jgi:hypothetical protein
MPDKQEIKSIIGIPFFLILGRPRSGTTLLRSLLDAHPNVIIPPEHSNMIHLFFRYQTKNARLTDKISAHFLKDFYQAKTIRTQWKLNMDAIRNNLHALNGERFSFTDMIKTVYFGYQSVHPKENILAMGDKSPVNSLYARKINKVFSDSKFIHLVRDYRANLASMMKQDLFSPSASMILMQWKKSVHRIDRLAARYPGRYLTIRYEDFVTDPAKHFMKICDFLNIPYIPGVLDAEKRRKTVKSTYASDFIRVWQPDLDRNITSENIGKWQNELSEKLIRKADFIAGRTGMKFGYQPTYKHFGVLFRCTMNFGTMFFYLNEVNRYLYDRLPYFLKPLIRERKFIISHQIIHLKHRLFDKE